MAEYIGYRDGGKTNEQGLKEELNQLLTPGFPTINNATGLSATQRGAGSNMSVDIQIGDVHIQKLTLDYSFWGWTDAVVNKTLTASDPTNPRQDIVVAYVDLSVVSSASNNNPTALKFAVVAGTPAGSPVDPSNATIQAAVGAGNPWQKLARVAVAANAANIVNANITDLRSTIAFKGRLWGGANNTTGHTVPNVADDTVQLLAAVQSPTNKTYTGNTNKMTSGGANSVLRDASNAQVDLSAQMTEKFFDHVASGIVITGDSLGTNKNYSITSGVVYIGGKRLTVAAVSAVTVGASKDRYIDLRDNNDGTAVYITNEVTNNAASQALTAGDMRVGIVVAGATTIAAAGSINQGQFDSVLPIASSIPYAVTDSIGNLICPRDPNRRILGYREIALGGAVTSASYTDVGGLNLNFIAPGNRKVKTSFYCAQMYVTAAATTGIAIVDVTSSTTLLDSNQNMGNTVAQTIAAAGRPQTPAAGARNYKVQGKAATGTLNFSASATIPTFMIVELV